MIHVHSNILSGKAHWTVDRSQSASPEDLVKLTFSTAAFATISERDAYETIRVTLGRESVTWVELSADEWRLDLEGLSAVIARPDMVPWLRGTVVMRPEFKSEILSPGPPKIGNGQFVFYITPDTVAAGTMPRRKEVFICYSHADKKWLERVRVHLRPLEKQGLLELFDDSKIRPGARWREEISAALERFRIVPESCRYELKRRIRVASIQPGSWTKFVK